jgi:hypothetical protein
MGYGLAYIDFSSQGIGIAAALSGDELMMKGYLKLPRRGAALRPVSQNRDAHDREH